MNKEDYTKENWYYLDNGFDSVKSMDTAHKQIVKLASSVLKKGDKMVDFGCGNGALLKKNNRFKSGHKSLWY